MGVTCHYMMNYRLIAYHKHSFINIHPRKSPCRVLTKVADKTQMFSHLTQTKNILVSYWIAGSPSKVTRQLKSLSKRSLQELSLMSKLWFLFFLQRNTVLWHAWAQLAHSCGHSDLDVPIHDSMILISCCICCIQLCPLSFLSGIQPP